MKSFLRWAGSKRQALGTLKGHLPKVYSRYLEPFAGSASLFFDIEPRDAILGDLNPELMCTMQSVQSQVDQVIDCLSLLPRNKNSYYKIRSIDPKMLSPAEVAARFIYLNHYCFNGLYRTNSSGYFNVPLGRSKSERGIDEEMVLKASKVLQAAVLITGDFQKILKHATEKDFVYLDPPYIVRRRRVFSEYLPGSFNSNDFSRLDSCLHELDERGAYFVVSYADSTEARKLFKKWRVIRMAIKRNIAGFVDSRRTAYELVATNVPREELE